MVLFKISGGEIEPVIHMPLTGTIQDLKGRLYDELGVEIQRQSLWYNTRELKNHEVVQDYDFPQNATLNLTVRPLPGRPKLHVLVRSTGANGYVRVRETDKVRDLRRKIVRYWGIPPERFTLHRLNKEMEDDRPLYVYYINEDSEIELSVIIDPR